MPVRCAATREHRGQAALPAGLHHAQARHRAQAPRESSGTRSRSKIAARDDGGRDARLLRRRLVAGCRHHHAFDPRPKIAPASTRTGAPARISTDCVSKAVRPVISARHSATPWKTENGRRWPVSGFRAAAGDSARRAWRGPKDRKTTPSTPPVKPPAVGSINQKCE